MRKLYLAIFVVIFVAIVVVSFSPLGFFMMSDSAVGIRVTEHGVVQEVISDCPPYHNQTCTFFDINVLRSDDGRTYLLTNFSRTMANEWKNESVSITGFLFTPSKSGLNFIDGDLYVETVTAE
jgi:hypothetical protein